MLIIGRVKVLNLLKNEDIMKKQLLVLALISAITQIQADSRQFSFNTIKFQPPAAAIANLKVGDAIVITDVDPMAKPPAPLYLIDTTGKQYAKNTKADYRSGRGILTYQISAVPTLAETPPPVPAHRPLVPPRIIPPAPPVRTTPPTPPVRVESLLPAVTVIESPIAREAIIAQIPGQAAQRVEIVPGAQRQPIIREEAPRPSIGTMVTAAQIEQAATSGVLSELLQRGQSALKTTAAMMMEPEIARNLKPSEEAKWTQWKNEGKKRELEAELKRLSTDLAKLSLKLKSLEQAKQPLAAEDIKKLEQLKVDANEVGRLLRSMKTQEELAQEKTEAELWKE